MSRAQRLPEAVAEFLNGKSLKEHYEGAPSERVPLDCNGKPLTYVPRPQLGRCWFDKSPHHKNDSCFRWYVLREDEQCRGTP